ncbi:MAG: OmpA family protein [Pseudomonadota bacterium]|nr:OmpA family protein [Pseudomonadota bacterium]
MSVFINRPKILCLLATLAVSVPGSSFAQQQTTGADLNVSMPASPPHSEPAIKGPEVRGIISARKEDQIQVTTSSGARTIIAINDATRITASNGFLGLDHRTFAKSSLLNGLPVVVETLQSGDALMASQITFRNNDFKTAMMIRNGTAQGFDEQTAATEALRGRMGDIDEYNIKGTTNVNFNIGRADLSAQAQADLCAEASAAEATKNALLLVVGYTDSTGSDDYNQRLSEKRASRVVNYLQQACHWKPYRMLTPTGMAKADPLASNDSADGKAQNRRVAVNILVSKAVDGM